MSLQGLKLASGALNLCGLDRVTQLTKETERSNAQAESPGCAFKIFLRGGFYQEALVSAFSPGGRSRLLSAGYYN